MNAGDVPDFLSYPKRQAESNKGACALGIRIGIGIRNRMQIPQTDRDSNPDSDPLLWKSQSVIGLELRNIEV